MNNEIIFKEFEKLPPLQNGDFISIEQYGGGPEESSLKGTRNALNHFAWEILKVSLENKDEYGMDIYVDKSSVAGIDSIEVCGETREQALPSFGGQIVGFIFVAFFFLVFLLAIIGAFTVLNKF